MPRWTVIDSAATVLGSMMRLMFEYPWLTATVVVTLLLLAGAALAAVSGRRRAQQARRLSTDVPEPQNDKPESGAAPVLETLAQTLPDVTLVHTETILYANDAAAELFGNALGTLQGKPVTDLMRPAYRAMVRRQVRAQLNGDQPCGPLEVQLINGDERGLWAELHSRVIDFDSSQAILTVARDISHRKSMEVALGRGKLQARTTLESIGEGVITTDTTGVIDYMNEAAEHLTGTSRSSGIGKRLTDLLHL